MNKLEIFEEVKKDTKEIESWAKVLRAYCIDEVNDTDISTTMLPALEIIINKINDIRNNINKIKND